MKKGIVQFTGFVPKSPKSHVRGWALAWSNILDAEIVEKNADLDQYDALYIDQGVNYSPGTLNLFGGVNDEVVAHLEALVRFKGNVTMLDYSLQECGYHSLIQKRSDSGANSNSDFLTQGLVDDIGNLKWGLKTMSSVVSDTVVIGDSHSISFAPSGAAIIRRDGSTLRGEIINMRAMEYLAKSPIRYKKVILSFGSVDIRHHALRGSFGEFMSMINLYVGYAKTIASNHNVTVELCCAVPVEFEGRRIPKTGYFEGTPFYGTQEERALYTEVFNEEIRYKARESYGLDSASPPIEWYNMDPEKYAKNIMETGSSVHIAPAHYRMNRL